MREGWNVRIVQDLERAVVKVWFINAVQRQYQVVTSIQNGEMTVTSLSPFEVLPSPTLEIQETVAPTLLQGLAEALAEAGYKVKDESREGEIAAQRAHLEDMRHLVFEALLPPEMPPPRLGQVYKKE